MAAGADDKQLNSFEASLVVRDIERAIDRVRAALVQ
jgi:hypothetical protein